MQRMKRMRLECEGQTFIRRVMREHQWSVSSHPNEGGNISRHSRLENKHGNEGQGGRYKKRVALWETVESLRKQLRDLVFIE